MLSLPLQASTSINTKGMPRVLLMCGSSGRAVSHVWFDHHGPPPPMWPRSVAVGRRSYAVGYSTRSPRPVGSVDKRSGNPDHMGMTDHTLPALPDYDLADELGGRVVGRTQGARRSDPQHHHRAARGACCIDQSARQGSEQAEGQRGAPRQGARVRRSDQGCADPPGQSDHREILREDRPLVPIDGLKDSELSRDFAVQQALGSAVSSHDLPATVTARYARIPADRANEYITELIAIVDRFKAEAPAGDTVYAMVAGVFPTDQPFIAPNESSP